MILVFNKTDAQDAAFAKEWMTNFEAFQEALRNEEEGGSFGGEGSALGGGSGYMGSLLNSMSLVLDEFYQHLSVVGVSSMTGEGIEEFFKGVEEKRQEFERDYRPELERKKAQREQEKVTKREKDLNRLMKDMKVGGVGKKKPPKDNPETVSEAEEGSDDDIGVDDDDSEDDETEGGIDLQSRYQQALRDSRPGEGGPSGEDYSFARYVHQAKLG